jgi:NADH-quinone oxidoreductase subunit J
MTFISYAACAIALMSALLVITRRNAMHALIYLTLMLLALGLVFFTLGAPFVAVLQIIIYAGAIMVLFVFVVMLLKIGPTTERLELRWLGIEIWAIPTLLIIFLLLLSGYALMQFDDLSQATSIIGPGQVGLLLYRKYLLIVELASLVLTAGLIAAFHLAPPTAQARARAQKIANRIAPRTEEQMHD